MRKWLPIVALTLAACASSTGTDASSPPDVGCETPPATELESDSELQLGVEPNPAQPMSEAALLILPTGLPADAASGVDAAWQCWDGSSWVTTHIVYRGVGELAGQTIPVNSEFHIQVPSIGLPVGVGYPIVVPDVDPGTYRIEDEVILGDESVRGFVLVEVGEG